MRFLILIYFIFLTITIQAQGIENPLPGKLTITTQVPKDLLAKRACVFYASDYTNEQLDVIQSAFQKTGIDAVAYFKSALVFGGIDITDKVVDYLIKREIEFIVLVAKDGNNFSFTFTTFNGTKEFVNNGQPGWEVTNPNLNETLLSIYRSTANSQQVKNLLINTYPEKNFQLNIIEGRRSDFFAIDLKVDHLAVPWFGDATRDTLLFQFFKENYPFTYSMTVQGLDRKELRAKGFHYILAYVHTEGAIARELLGYQNTSNESALTSVTYPNGAVQLKTLSAEAPVYKFYFKHLESGNVFLGTKWDADVTWQEALRNHIKGFKAELKIP